MKTYICRIKTNLKDFTDMTFPQAGFVLPRLLEERDVKVNGRRVGANICLLPGDEIVYYTTPAQESVKSHELVYEDDNIYIADKFQGVSSEALETELSESGRCKLVHRIDRNTAGILVFAKNYDAEHELLDAFRTRRVEKEYLCLCKNRFKKKSDLLKAYLRKDSVCSDVRVIDSFVKGASEIETEYEVIEERGDIALVKVILHSGRTHQIRAHMAHIGCPVLGDEKYGDRALNAKYNAKRQRLVAKSVTFRTKGVLKYLNGKTFSSSQHPDTLVKGSDDASDVSL